MSAPAANQHQEEEGEILIPAEEEEEGDFDEDQEEIAQRERWQLIFRVRTMMTSGVSPRGLSDVERFIVDRTTDGHPFVDAADVIFAAAGAHLEGASGSDMPSAGLFGRMMQRVVEGHDMYRATLNYGDRNWFTVETWISDAVQRLFLLTQRSRSHQDDGFRVAAFLDESSPSLEDRLVDLLGDNVVAPHVRVLACIHFLVTPMWTDLSEWPTLRSMWRPRGRMNRQWRDALVPAVALEIMIRRGMSTLVKPFVDLLAHPDVRSWFAAHRTVQPIANRVDALYGVVMDELVASSHLVDDPLPSHVAALSAFLEHPLVRATALESGTLSQQDDPYWRINIVANLAPRANIVIAALWEHGYVAKIPDEPTISLPTELKEGFDVWTIAQLPVNHPHRIAAISAITRNFVWDVRITPAMEVEQRTLDRLTRRQPGRVDPYALLGPELVRAIGQFLVLRYSYHGWRTAEFTRRIRAIAAARRELMEVARVTRAIAEPRQLQRESDGATIRTPAMPADMVGLIAQFSTAAVTAANPVRAEAAVVQRMREIHDLLVSPDGAGRAITLLTQSLNDIQQDPWMFARRANYATPTGGLDRAGPLRILVRNWLSHILDHLVKYPEPNQAPMMRASLATALHSLIHEELGDPVTAPPAPAAAAASSQPPPRQVQLRVRGWHRHSAASSRPLQNMMARPEEESKRDETEEDADQFFQAMQPQ